MSDEELLWSGGNVQVNGCELTVGRAALEDALVFEVSFAAGSVRVTITADEADTLMPAMQRMLDDMRGRV